MNPVAVHRFSLNGASIFYLDRLIGLILPSRVG